jgi:uncharacterized membrane protein
MTAAAPMRLTGYRVPARAGGAVILEGMAGRHRTDEGADTGGDADPAGRRSALAGRGADQGRLAGVDVARAVALVGMMAIHIFPGRDPDQSISTPYLIASGRAAATFAVLAGVGLALASAGFLRGGTAADTSRRATGMAVSVMVRGLAIGAIGLAIGYFESGVAVILAYYAMLFVLAAGLLRLPSRQLVGIGVVAAVVVPAASLVLRAGLPQAQGDNPTFDTLLTEPGRLLLELTLTGYYPALPWMAYLVAGLVVGRLPLRSSRVAAWLLAGGAALAVAAAACSELLLGRLGGRDAIAATTSLEPGSVELERYISESQFGATPTTTWWWLAVDSPHSSTPLDLLHTTGVALAVLGLSLLVVRVASRLLLPLAAAGSMTLTLYTAHVLSLATQLLPDDPFDAYLVTVVAALLFALAWRSAWRRGPLEAVVARLAGAARRAALR